MNKSNTLCSLSFALGIGIASSVALSGCAALVVGAGAGTAGAVIGSDSRTVGQMADDEKIEIDSREILKSDASLSDRQSFSVDVVSVNGQVLLVGQTTNAAYLSDCISRIERLNGVRKVYNYVENKAPVSAGVVANDTYITSKVKSMLLVGEKISSGRFKVVTEDSNVYLMGFVTHDEAKRAINQTKKVSGVKKIFTIFDYMNSPTAESSSGSSSSSEPEVTSLNNDSSSQVRSSSSYAKETQSSVNNGGATIVDDDDLLAPSQPANW